MGVAHALPSKDLMRVEHARAVYEIKNY